MSRFFSCINCLTWIMPPLSYLSMAAWTLSIVVLRVLWSYGSMMPVPWRSRADKILMFLPFFSIKPYVPFMSSVSNVTSPPKTVARRASSYSVSVVGKLASRFM